MKTHSHCKRHTALNTQLFMPILLFLSFAGICVACAVEKEVGLAVAFGFATLLPVFVFAISPLYVVFDEEAVTVVYNFGQRETVAWKEIRGVSLMGGWFSMGGGPPHYVLSFRRAEKRPFFVVGEIPKTRKTKKFITLYYKGKIV